MQKKIKSKFPKYSSHHNENDHTPHAISERLASDPKHSYLRDWVYGGIDGAVTTFAVVTGVEGASLSSKIVLIMGVANLIADGFSMAASNYLGTKTEHDELEHYTNREHWEIKELPEGEREEVRQIFRRSGFEGDLLEKAVQTVTADPERWVRLMLTEEHGLPLSIRSPWRAGVSTFIAFILCGTMPLIPYIFGLNQNNGMANLGIASVCTGITFFLIGSLKSAWTVHPWWKSGLITLLIGMLAAGMAYGIGFGLRVLTQ